MSEYRTQLEKFDIVTIFSWKSDVTVFQYKISSLFMDASQQVLVEHVQGK